MKRRRRFHSRVSIAPYKNLLLFPNPVLVASASATWGATLFVASSMNESSVPGKQFSASYPGNMKVNMGNFRVLVLDWLKDFCCPWKESNIRVVVSDWSVMWKFWVITGKLKVVFRLGNFGLTKGLQSVYRVVGKNISRSRRNSSSRGWCIFYVCIITSNEYGISDGWKVFNLW